MEPWSHLNNTCKVFTEFYGTFELIFALWNACRQLETIFISKFWGWAKVQPFQTSNEIRRLPRRSFPVPYLLKNPTCWSRFDGPKLWPMLGIGLGFSITPEVNLTLTRGNKIAKKNYFAIPIRASFIFHRINKKNVIFSSMLLSQYWIESAHCV